MPTQRLSMRRIKEVLRLKHFQGLPERAIARSVGVSNGVVHSYLSRVRSARLSWPLPEGMTDEDLELLLFPAPRPASQSPQRPVPDWSYIDKELRRRNVTRRLLWEEYRAVNPDGFGYTWFCTTYEAWKGRARPSMRQIHLGGEKVFVDFAGDTIDIVDPLTGEVQPMKLFVAAMGASNYTYAEACPSESLADWIRAHVNLFTFLSGTPTFVVCDNLKAADSNPDRFDPGLNRTYAEMASHYGTAILAARPRRPKDKAKVEVAVQIAQRWILARLRNQRFFSRAELNAAIKTLVDELNARQMRGFGSSRAELFAELDKPKLTPLPDQPYAFARWKRCRVAPDYHVEVDGHWYSAPYRLIGELVDARIDDRTVEIFHKGKRIASHARAPNRRGHTTIADHMPSAHRRYGKWTPAAVIAAGERIGPSTAAFFQAVIDARPHPEQGFRTCLGILALVKSYGAERVDAACRRGILIKARSVASIRSILQNGLDRTFFDESFEHQPLRHGNIRGRDYFH
ncbi:IS21 family transposase [Bradyrhizobium sp. CB82]|uniref:IS21 family transposase n=1 Tax=Bradyrhizobium sp. CB82 TaxID=3039159 RepID=UPI0024B2437B|nr:IS21 family transposase [Bradyrhizobium sp. CB82]WFU39974.1 IS21 family transposase [Bradyrhizobium sp. CB82]